MPVGQHLRLRGFIEGIEVPIISAALSIQPDAPAQCQVQIPATDKAHEFLPRSLVHIFFYDFYDGPSDTLVAAAAEPEQVSSSEEYARDQVAQMMRDDLSLGEYGELSGSGLPPDDDFNLPADTGDGQAASIHQPFGIGSVTHHEEDLRWKKFFSGEIMGYQFVKSSTSRSIILNCMDESIYWDTCYQYKVNVASLHGNGMAHFVGAGTTMFDVFFQSSVATMVDIVMRKSHSQPNLSGLLSGVVHLLEHVGGVYTSRGFRGVNDFFSLAELRLHLVQMITASQDDESSRNLFPRRAFSRWTRREGGRLGKIASFREMLNLLNRFIFHSTFPCPISKYDPAETRQRVRRVSYELKNTARGRRALQSLADAKLTAERLKNTWENILPGSMLSELEQFNARLITLTATLAALRASSAAGKVRSAQQIIVYLRQILRGLGGGAFRASAESDTQAQFTRVYEYLRDAHDELNEQTVSRNRSTNYTTGARMNSQIIRPDIFMVSPPRCNVLFPELYHNVQYARQFMREVTRMRLTVSDEVFGPEVLLDNWYYAPDVEVLGERVRQGRGGTIEGATLRQAAFTKRLMDHELYTGVIPVFERMNEVNIVAASSNQVSFRGARVPFVTRAANFQFFKNRFGPRSMSVSGKFNPWAVAGFPAVVIDRHMTAEQVGLSNLRGLDLLGESLSRGWANVIDESRSPTTEGDYDPDDSWLALRETVPTQFVGLVANLSHQVSQTQASTTYSLTSARTHREREELLGANNVRVSRRIPGQATRRTVVAALEGDPPRVGQLGPRFGLITAVERVNRSGRHHLFGTFRGDQPRRGRTLVTVNITQAAREYGAEAVTLVGDPDLEVTFVPYRVTEQIDRWRGQRVDVPLEDFLRPPWMSEVWANDRIGAVYQQFFGTGAITDPATIDTGYSSAYDEANPQQTSVEQQSRNQNYQDPIRADGHTTQNASMAISVEKAIDLLVRAYSAIRQQPETDVHEFVRAYTWRPVANLIDLLGSRNLRIDPGSGNVIDGIEGFHSRAFGHGPMGRNLRNLISETEAEETRSIRRILGIRAGEGQDRRNLLSRLDKRAEKADRVLAYVDELAQNRGHLG